jgi:hypothetical protein
MQCALQSEKTPARRLEGEGVMSEQRKPRGPNRIRKREITRAFEAVPGATSVEIFPADGRMIVHRGTRPDAVTSSTNPWDAVSNAADSKRAS